MKCLGQWQAFVVAGKDRADQHERLKQAPAEMQEAIISHMRTVYSIKKRQESNNDH